MIQLSIKKLNFRKVLSENLVLNVPSKFIMSQLQTSTLDDYTKTIQRSRISDFHRMREQKKTSNQAEKKELRTGNLTASEKCE